MLGPKVIEAKVALEFMSRVMGRRAVTAVFTTTRRVTYLSEQGCTYVLDSGVETGAEAVLRVGAPAIALE